MDKLIIIDGNSLANRAFYALLNMRSSKGVPTGAIFGIANIIVKLISEKKPTHMVVAFDHAKKTFRNELYSDYKGTRKPMPEELAVQMPLIKDMLNKMGIKVIEQNGIEADDIVGTIAKKHFAPTYIISGDRDLWQLIDNDITVWFTKKGVTDIEELTPQTLLNNYSLIPSQIVDLKSLMGDSSDNIPGVKGVGEISAKKLIEQYQSLDNIYDNIDNISGSLKAKLLQNRETAYLSYKLASIKTDCDLDINYQDFKIKFPFDYQTYKCFEEYSFSTLLKRKEIFDGASINQEKNKSNNQAKIKIEDLSTLEQELKNQDLTEIVFDTSTSLYIEFANKYFEQSVQVDLFSEPVDKTKFINVIMPYLNNHKIVKIANKLKDQLPDLCKCGLKDITNFYDIMLAEYLTSGADVMNNKYYPLEYYEKYIQTKKLLSEYEMEYLFYSVEMPLCWVLFCMEQNGFMVDETQINQLSKKYLADLNVIENEIYQLAGEQFNIKSPVQLATILFDKLGLPITNNKKRSTSIEILTKLKDQHEIIDKIITHRKIQKLSSTYVEVYKLLVQKHGNILRTIYNQTGTNTGRISSSEPNLQNIPIRDEQGKYLRKFFISRFQNGALLSVDYSQAELRLVAMFSKDQTMIDAFKKDEDIHSITASNILDKPLDQVTSVDRRIAKAVNFGIIYGISEFGLSENIGCTVIQAREYITRYFDKYAKVKEYMNQLVEQAKQCGYAKTYFNRRRNIHEISSSNYALRQFGERVAMNMPLQGSESDIIKIAMLKIHNYLHDNNLKSKLVLQIHDEVVLDCEPSEIDILLKKIPELMESVISGDVILKTDASIGKNLYDCK